MYYLLLVKEDGYWTVEFSDYDIDTVLYERDSMYLQHRRKDMRIAKINSDSQSVIDETVYNLNRSATSHTIGAIA